MRGHSSVDNSNFIKGIVNNEPTPEQPPRDSSGHRKSYSSKGPRPANAGSAKKNRPKSSRGNRSFDITHTKHSALTGKRIAKKKNSIGYGNSRNKEIVSASLGTHNFITNGSNGAS